MARHYRKDISTRGAPRHISAAALSDPDIIFEESDSSESPTELVDPRNEVSKNSSSVRKSYLAASKRSDLNLDKTCPSGDPTLGRSYPGSDPSTGRSSDPTVGRSYPYLHSPKVIASFGLILFHRSYGAKTKFLIYQRRDTYDFIDLMRGLWSNEYRLREMCCSLTPDEKQRIRDHSFRELWDDLWIVHGSHIHLEGYERAFRKFEMAKTTIMASINLEVSVSPPAPPWGFPKGKKNSHEKEFDCAMREFVEETNLNISGIEVVEGKTYLESYKGSNGKLYSSHYFLAESPVELEINRVRTPAGCIREWTISPESADLRWVTSDEAFDLLDLRKADILRKAEEFISELPFLSSCSFSTGTSISNSVPLSEADKPRALLLGKKEGTFRYTKLSDIPEFRPKSHRKHTR